jgi:serine/threonine protein kinase
MLAKFRTERCAVKQIICETKAEYRASMQEMLLMQELQFDKIVRFFGAIKHSPQCLWICMEYMPFSDLRKILHSPKHRSECRFSETLLTLARRLKWAKDVVAALDLLHSRCVVHRDLKPGNILISNKYDAVLSDFGLSRVRAAQQSRLQVWPGLPSSLALALHEVCMCGGDPLQIGSKR